MKIPALSPKKRATVAAALVAGAVLWWYFPTFPWLAAVMGALAGFFTLNILRSGRIERWRRPFFIGITALSAVTFLAYAFFWGTGSFGQVIAAWDPGYYYSGTGASGAMLFPTPIVMPSIFWRGAEFLPDFGMWQTTVPTSLAAAFVFMIPVILLFAVFGRSLCGWMCPLGGLPEAAAAAGREWWPLSFLKEKRVSNGGVSYRVLKPWVHMVRFGFLAVVVALSLVAGFSLVNIFYPLLWLKSMPVFWTVTGLLALFAVALPLLTRRRWWCYICPVGAALSLLERVSLFRIYIDRAKCVRCFDCVRACRYYALEPQGVEQGRCRGELCVRCGRCIEASSEDAIDITLLGSRKKAREPFVALLVTLAFFFYAWFAIELVHLLSRLSDFRWWG